MGQKITNEGDCPYCHSSKKGVWYRGMYSQDEELLEIHCNTCRASWNPDGTPRAIPSEATLEKIGILENVKEAKLPYSTGIEHKWHEETRG